MTAGTQVCGFSLYFGCFESIEFRQRFGVHQPECSGELLPPCFLLLSEVIRHLAQLYGQIFIRVFIGDYLALYLKIRALFPVCPIKIDDGLCFLPIHPDRCCQMEVTQNLEIR